VVVGVEGTILTSPDGTTWSNRTFSQTYDYSNIIHANGMFVIVGYSGTIVTSSNGINLEKKTSPVSNSLFSIVYGKEIFVCVGSSGTILTSHDGSTWTKTNITGHLYYIVYGNEMFVTTGDDGIFTSDDRSNWTLRKSGAVTKIIYGYYRFIAVQGINILNSSDGITW
jgi:photosystem II stability/assembly factor-like uncharacterized protein